MLIKPCAFSVSYSKNTDKKIYFCILHCTVFCFLCPRHLSPLLGGIIWLSGVPLPPANRFAALLFCSCCTQPPPPLRHPVYAGCSALPHDWQTGHGHHHHQCLDSRGYSIEYLAAAQGRCSAISVQAPNMSRLKIKKAVISLPFS